MVMAKQRTLFDPAHPPTPPRRPNGMLVPLRKLNKELCELNVDLPGKVASAWAHRYRFNRDELESELVVEYCNVCARMQLVRKEDGTIIGTGGRPPRNYIYSALRRRIVDLVEIRGREPDLQEYGQIQHRLRPSPSSPLGDLLREEERWGHLVDFCGTGGGMGPQGGGNAPA